MSSYSDMLSRRPMIVSMPSALSSLSHCAVDEAAVHQQVVKGTVAPGVPGRGKQALTLGEVGVLTGPAGGEVPQQRKEPPAAAQPQHTGLELGGRAAIMPGRNSRRVGVQHRHTRVGKHRELLEQQG